MASERPLPTDAGVNVEVKPVAIARGQSVNGSNRSLSSQNTLILFLYSVKSISNLIITSQRRDRMQVALGFECVDRLLQLPDGVEAKLNHNT